MDKKIKILTILLIVMSVIGFIGSFPIATSWMYENGKVSNLIIYPINFILNIPKIYIPNDFLSNYSHYSLENKFYIAPQIYLSLLLKICVIIFGVVFITSEGRKGIRFIHFVLGIILINTIIFLPLFLYNVFFPTKPYEKNTVGVILYFISLTLNLWFVLYFNKLLKNNDANVYKIDTSGTIFGNEVFEQQFQHVSKNKRFCHYLIDIFICYCFAFTLSKYLNSLMHRENFYSFEKVNTSFFYVIWIYMLFFYYSLLEGLLGYTVGKAILGSFVLNEDTSPIGYGKATLRTLSRFVPLEPLSALGVSPWHDNWTKTIVVEKVKTEEITTSLEDV